MNRLQKDTQYFMLVKSVMQNRKSFPKKGITHYVHDIYFVDEANAEYLGEYVTREAHQTDFILGEKACFMVAYDGGMGVEIEPCIAKPDSMGNIPEAIERDFIKVAGDSHNYAMSYAKDIFCAKIAAGIILMDTEEDVKELCKLAFKINNWLVDPHEPEPF